MHKKNSNNKKRNRNLLKIIDEGDFKRFRIRTVESEIKKLKKSRARRKTNLRKIQGEML